MSTTRKICCKKCGAEAEFTSLEIQALRNLDKRASEWVSIKTDLPESGQDVLFYDGSVKKGWFDDFNNIDKTKGRFFWELGSANNSFNQSKITHWQPISPPKGDE